MMVRLLLQKTRRKITRTLGLVIVVFVNTEFVDGRQSILKWMHVVFQMTDKFKKQIFDKLI